MRECTLSQSIRVRARPVASHAAAGCSGRPRPMYSMVLYQRAMWFHRRTSMMSLHVNLRIIEYAQQ